MGPHLALQEQPQPQRPWTVAVAAWLVAVPAAVGLVLAVVGAAALVVLGQRVDAMLAEVGPRAAERVEVGSLLAVGLALLAFVGLVAALQLVLVVGLLRGGGVPRLLLSAWQVLQVVLVAPVLVGLLVDPEVPLTSGPTVATAVELGLSVLVLVLLRTPRSSQWFAARAQAVRSARASRSSPSSMTARSLENVHRTSERPPPGASGLS